jgi:tRNA(fMet)-specific endonuclease VapC
VLVLDTDHIVELQKEDAVHGGPLTTRLEVTRQPRVVTIISAEEQMRGWLSAIHSMREPFRQVRAYGELRALFGYYSRWQVRPFDALAAGKFASLRKIGVRVGTMDLKIASIALVSGAKLLSRNLVDFEKVPGLVVENWLS